MKKNILTIIIMALTIVNVILSSVLIFVVVPASNRTNNLITKVANVIDLELASSTDKDVADNIDVTKLENYTIEDELSFNLTLGTSGEPHWGVLDSITLSLNTESKDYKKLKDVLAKNETYIQEIVTNVISSYPYDSAIDSREEMKVKSLQKIQEYFDSEFVVEVSFGSLRFQ
ncbi:hypothetical protein [Anaeromicropila populeti]|uniref:Flagellar FliL protein n=1 Tax=Anaeromicropila populeti TaxID=37658 RepID=A0A1I6KXC5_9FIRM|nr:hypothetical protein [Anaeromicropila populeti]SFR95876.1 flagellar FliL protein [Anaeromicropila populeti]